MPTIETQMTEIQEMDLPALRDAWRRHYRVPPPRRLSRDLLMRGIAYKLQEQVHGGLSKAARRRLRALAQAFAETGRVAPDNGTKVRPAHGWCANGEAAPMSSPRRKAASITTGRPMVP